VRFATQRYSSSSASYRQRRRHLTNYAVNKGHAGGATADGGAAAQHGISGDGEGELDATVGSGGGQGGDEGRGGARHCPKWSLAMLRRHLEARGHDWGHVWEQVMRQEGSQKFWLQGVRGSQPLHRLRLNWTAVVRITERQRCYQARVSQSPLTAALRAAWHRGRSKTSLRRP
jgi:hypothetical protein